MTSTAVDAGPRIGSLFSGVGGLDLAVLEVLGGTVAWHSQYEPPGKTGKPDPQYAARILAHHWPGVPNLGDITAVDWTAALDEHGPVDILTGGFPCQDVSLAGMRRGMAHGNRSGLWSYMATAIQHLQPRLVVIENVRGLLSADAHGDLEPCPGCLGDGPEGPVLRALGAVLGDLADLGFDAEWVGLPASDVGATHQRWREFILARPAAEDPDVAARGQRGFAAPGQEEAGRPRPDAGRRGGAPAADADSDALRQQPVAVPGRSGQALAAVPGTATAADADSGRREGHPQCDGRQDDGQPEHQLGLDVVGRGLRGEAPADPGSRGRDGLHERNAQRHVATGPGESGAGVRADPASGQTDWGPYGPAIARWEHVLGRPAPSATDDLGRLSPVFVEWMMGLSAGHVTAVPGIPKNAQLKALGNGVVPAQAAAALRLLLARMPSALSPA